MTRYSSNSRSPRRGRVSAGLLMYRWGQQGLEVFLARPGGPWFPHREHDIWTVPKGEVENGEDDFEAAIREFQEEVGLTVSGPFLDLGLIRQKGGKTVHAWAFEGDWDPGQPIQTSLVEIEWPPGSGQWSVWPEIDRAGFFSLSAAREHMKLAQQPFLDRLANLVGFDDFVKAEATPDTPPAEAAQRQSFPQKSITKTSASTGCNSLPNST